VSKEGVDDLDKSASFGVSATPRRSTSSLGREVMPTTEQRRPKRLWAVSIMNIVLAMMAVVAIVFMLTSDRVPVEVRPTSAGATISALLAAYLTISSILALIGYRKARWLVLTAAFAFFGIMLLRSFLLIIYPSDLIPKGSAPKLWPIVIRSAIEIGLNVWVFLGAKYKLYLRALDAPPT
jgi:hypothetical protein